MNQTEPRYWIKHKRFKDNYPIWTGFSNMREANKYIKQMTNLGYHPTFDRKLERESCVKIAMFYISNNLSFRSFENEQNIHGTESPSIWSEAAAKLKESS